MRRVLIGLAFMVAIAGAVVGYIYLTTVTDVAIGPGWRLVAAARGGPWTFAEDDPPHATIITGQDRLVADWSVLGVSIQQPQPDFAEEVVVRTTFFGSGSCPEHLDGLTFEGDRVIATASRGFTMACSGDAIPYTFMLIVERDHLPAVPFAIVVRSDSFVREVLISTVD